MLPFFIFDWHHFFSFFMRNKGPLPLVYTQLEKRNAVKTMDKNILRLDDNGLFFTLSLAPPVSISWMDWFFHWLVCKRQVRCSPKKGNKTQWASEERGKERPFDSKKWSAFLFFSFQGGLINFGPWKPKFSLRKPGRNCKFAGDRDRAFFSRLGLRDYPQWSYKHQCIG